MILRQKLRAKKEKSGTKMRTFKLCVMVPIKFYRWLSSYSGYFSQNAVWGVLSWKHGQGSNCSTWSDGISTQNNGPKISDKIWRFVSVCQSLDIINIDHQHCHIKNLSNGGPFKIFQNRKFQINQKDVAEPDARFVKFMTSIDCSKATLQTLIDADLGG